MLQVISVIAELIFVWLQTKEKIYSYAFNIVSTILLSIVFYNNHLYASLSMQIILFLMIPYGIIMWSTNKDGSSVRPTRRASRREIITYIIVSVLSVSVFGTALHIFTNATVPYFDSVVFILTIIANFMTANKIYENWYFWMVMNLFAMLVYGTRGLYWLVGLNAIYLYLNIIGLRDWKSNM